MSALGHKQTYAVQQSMSALSPIATAKADFRTTSCLLYPQKRTCAVQLGMSALGQKRTLRHSFDHVVGAAEQRLRDGQAEGFGGFDVDHQLELGGLLDREVCRFCTLQNLVHVVRTTPEQLI